jgi:Amt family ammonium transporter
MSGDPLTPELWQALMIGAASGVIVTVIPPFIDRLHVDDAAAVVPVHLLCGFLGILSVAWTNDQARIVDQIAGASAIAAISFLLVMMGWAVLRYTVGVRHIAPEDFILDEGGKS